MKCLLTMTDKLDIKITWKTKDGKRRQHTFRVDKSDSDYGLTGPQNADEMIAYVMEACGKGQPCKIVSTTEIKGSAVRAQYDNRRGRIRR